MPLIDNEALEEIKKEYPENTEYLLLKHGLDSLARAGIFLEKLEPEDLNPYALDYAHDYLKQGWWQIMAAKKLMDQKEAKKKAPGVATSEG